MRNKDCEEILKTFEGLREQLKELQAVEMAATSAFVKSILNELKEAYSLIDKLSMVAKQDESEVIKKLQ